MFSAPGGGVRRVSHNPKLRMYSGFEQAMERYLHEPENALIESFFPGMSAKDRYGDNKPGGGQGLEGRLEELRDEYLRFDRSLLVNDPRRKEPKHQMGRGARKKRQKSYR